MDGQRLDTALVSRGLTRSRTQAARLVADRRVRVDGTLARKPALPVGAASRITVDAGDDWASRGAYKLLGALDLIAIDPAGRRAVDAGASHGGFTDVLLRRGATAVAALDVGDGQLIPRLAGDDRVRVHDRLNIRDLDAAAIAVIHRDLGGVPDLLVADLSFISLTLVLPVLAALIAPTGDLMPMVKPQFEVGKGRLGAHGVVRGADLRGEAVTRVVQVAATLGWGLASAVASPLPGPSGNVEYFLHLRQDAPADPDRARDTVRRAVARGPA